MTEYDHELCQDRHKRIPEEFKRMWDKIKQIENRFLITITLLLANLLGVIGILLVQ